MRNAGVEIEILIEYKSLFEQGKSTVKARKRKDAFIYEEKYDDVTGYTNPNGSEHDLFNVGHTST